MQSLATIEMVPDILGNSMAAQTVEQTLNLGSGSPMGCPEAQIEASLRYQCVRDWEHQLK